MSNNHNLGDKVHYVSHGSKDGKYPSVCRLAFITGHDHHENAHLAVLNPTGMFFNTAPYDSGPGMGGTYHYVEDHKDERGE